MFYSQFILAKKGPLGTIWIAAHLERKLRKNQVADTDIGVSVDSILFPEVPIALRLSSHLLLGVVRIYSRKVNYLFDDCSEALLKVKQAFRSAAVDLPPEESTAPYHSITLPETFDLDDFELPDNDIFQGNYVDRHVSSREQITLQDNLDSMVYKTSQFGLDERFGDGDASQIGLDLDEVMLIDKEATLEHDDFSANPQMSHQEDEKKEGVMIIDKDATLDHDEFSANLQVSHQEDENKEDVSGTSDRMQVEDSIDGLPTVAEFHEYAQGPSTPGLQEPNLFGTQADQVINDADFHNSADLLSMETTQNESCAHQTENDVNGCSLQNNGKHVDADLLHEASDCVLVEVDTKRKLQENLICTVVMKDQENLIPNNNCLASVPLMDDSNKNHPITMLPECTDGMIDASDILEKVEDLHDGVLMNTEPVVPPLNETVNVISGGSVSINDITVSPSCSNVTSDQEGLSCKLLSNMDGSRASEFDGRLKDDNTLSKHEVLNNSEISKNEEQPCVVDEAHISNIKSPLELTGRPEVVDMEAHVYQELKEADVLNHVSHEAEHPTESHLRPCTSHMNHPSLSSIEGEKCHETVVSDPALGNHGAAEPSVCEGNLDLGKSAMQFGSQIINNEVESINKSAASDIPEPEKMRSIAYQHDGEANNLLLESTPGNQGISEGHTDAAGVKSISGKKRSYTESTLTVQSMDLVESYGGAQSKRTAESIPDDDDLLSTILVGKTPSGFKVKPSPAATEVPSTKRFRSAPRTSTLKRKVLMDDMMVLHGDTIRQQLTSTEDIRRVRKKAPCTRHEILMIQRQFLEDKIFQEPIFTDLSADLTILRNETFDLSGIEVCDYGLDGFSVEKAKDQESYSKTSTEIHGVEENNEPVAVQPQEDAEAHLTELPVLSERMEAHNEPIEVQPQEDAEAHPTEIPVLSERVEAYNEPIAVQPREDAEAHPTEIPVLSECHHFEVDLGSHNIDAHGNANIISQVKELDSSQNAEMNNAEGNYEISESENCSVVPGHESLSITEVFENELYMPNDFDASLSLADKTNDLVGSIHTNVSNSPTSQKLDTYPILEDEFVEEQRDKSEVCAIKIAEHAMEIKTQVETDGLEANHLCASLATGSKEDNEYTDNQVCFNGDLTMEENVNNVTGGLNDDKIVSSGLGYNDKDAKFDGLFSENIEVDCLHSVTLVDVKENSLNDEENPVCQEAVLQSTMCHDVLSSPFVDQNDETNMVGNDTGFLNVGDDEILDDDDDAADGHGFTQGAEGTHFENSGWSSRTRAVAKYLQTLFDKEDLQGRQNLHLDNILAGKTRKEASRMFFETLVLKTRDYVHVEQTQPFANINLQPRMKLMKSDF
ncbi:sister chromatid cohesion 1 protein 4 isoform X2 [Cicer arietinum]|uniref:Sister chromatid cohesion 1 protein 4 isoform X2 n=1 Tax=Cicer arietinum TaxID=3827 RepID=A0A1S2XQE0_CICAR|nr:sister chromatid cohesion 1 protein 4 isoform X2 [Cicer arietinum]